MKSSQKLSPVLALMLILVSLFLFSGLGFKISKKIRRNLDQRVLVKKITYSSACSFNLPFTYFCELLDLHKEKSNYVRVRELAEYKRRILKSPLIKSTSLKIRGSVFEIDYILNYPRAKLFDFKNVLVDSDGIILPEEPFFSTLKLAKIYIGTNQMVVYEQKLKDPRFKHAMQFLCNYQDELESRGFFIDLLDVKMFYHPSIGKRQVVLTLEKNNKKYVLRLATKNFSKALKQFYCIEKKLNKEENIIDLRIKDMAIFT